MADVRAPDGDPPAQRAADGRRRNPVPQSFQTRLTFAFMAVVALTLTLVAPVLVLRLDDFFRQQEETRLQDRADATAEILTRVIGDTFGDQRPVVWVDPQTGRATLRPEVEALLIKGGLLQLVTDQVAQAKVERRVRPGSHGDRRDDRARTPIPAWRSTWTRRSPFRAGRRPIRRSTLPRQRPGGRTQRRTGASG